MATIKKFGNRYKLTLHKVLRQPGWQETNPDIWEPLRRKLFKATKELCNISRARSKVYEYAMCNEFDYFITGTIDATKYDRTDLDTYIKDLNQWIRNKRRSGVDIKYLFIPELHYDGVSWHVHGLIGGIRKEELSRFIKGVHPDKLVDGDFWNWGDYQKKFGFVSLGLIRNKEFVSSYITKYITKGLHSKGVSDLKKHMYYCSQGLNVADKIKTGVLLKTPEVWEYENDYIKIIWINEGDVNTYI